MADQVAKTCASGGTTVVPWGAKSNWATPFVWVNDQRLQEVEEKITKVARTGRIGDGKVFVMDVGWPGAMEF